MESIIFGLEIVRRALSRVGPYALVEILLPGGTLLALLFYVYRRARRAEASTDTLSIRRPVERLISDSGRPVAIAKRIPTPGMIEVHPMEHTR